MDFFCRFMDYGIEYDSDFEKYDQPAVEDGTEEEYQTGYVHRSHVEYCPYDRPLETSWVKLPGHRNPLPPEGRTGVVKKSVPYRALYHWRERIAQFTMRGPGVPSEVVDEMDRIKVKKYGTRVPNYERGERDIGRKEVEELCDLRPEWKIYKERWIYLRAEMLWEQPPDLKLKELWELDKYFVQMEKIYREHIKKDSRRHNLPNYNSLFIIFFWLHNRMDCAPFFRIPKGKSIIKKLDEMYKKMLGIYKPEVTYPGLKAIVKNVIFV